MGKPATRRGGIISLLAEALYPGKVRRFGRQNAPQQGEEVTLFAAARAAGRRIFAAARPGQAARQRVLGVGEAGGGQFVPWGQVGQVVERAAPAGAGSQAGRFRRRECGETLCQTPQEAAQGFVILRQGGCPFGRQRGLLLDQEHQTQGEGVGQIGGEKARA